MKALSTTLRLALLAAVAGTSLSAKDWTDNCEFKLRMGMTAGTLAKDLFDNKDFGLAVGTAFDLSETSAITVDLGVDYLPGRGRDVLPNSGAPIYYDQNGTVISSVNGAPLFVQVANSNGSADSRSRSAQGFSLRGGYRQAIANVPDLFWQAGLSLDSYKSTNQFVGNAVPLYMDPTNGLSTLTGPDGQTTAYEGWAFSRQRNVVSPGCYAGLAYKFQDEYRAEFNVRNVGTGVMDFSPLAYTGRPEAFSNRTSRGFVFELSLNVKF